MDPYRTAWTSVAVTATNTGTLNRYSPVQRPMGLMCRVRSIWSAGQQVSQSLSRPRLPRSFPRSGERVLLGRGGVIPVGRLVERPPSGVWLDAGLVGGGGLAD